jgi:hypothetical protein
MNDSSAGVVPYLPPLCRMMKMINAAMSKMVI